MTRMIRKTMMIRKPIITRKIDDNTENHNNKDLIVIRRTNEGIIKRRNSHERRTVITWKIMMRFHERRRGRAGRERENDNENQE